MRNKFFLPVLAVVMVLVVFCLMVCDRFSQKEFIRQEERHVPVIDRADIVVAGGGIAGCAAALTAADRGLEVVLIEDRAYLGYELTAPMRYRSDHYIYLPDFPVTDGICRHLKSTDIYLGDYVDPENLKVELNRLIRNNEHIRTYLFSKPTRAIVREGRICGAEIVNQSGRQIILGRMVIDATANGKLAVSAGAEVNMPAGPEVKVRRYLQMVTHDYHRTGGVDVPDSIGFPEVFVDSLPGLTAKFVEAVAVIPENEETHDRFSRFQSATLERIIALAGYLQEHVEGFDPGKPEGFFDPEVFRSYYPGDEVYFEMSPRVVCKEQAIKSEINAFKRLDPDVFRPNVQDGLLVTGRTVMPDCRCDLQSLLYIGEHAAGVAMDSLPDTDPARIADTTIFYSEPEPSGETVREYLYGVERGREYPAIFQEEVSLPVTGHVDVLVVGGGTSGAPAAITAARKGARVAVVEVLPHCGGIAVNGIHGYYWGLHYDNDSGKFVQRSALRHEIDMKTCFRPDKGVLFDPHKKKSVLQKLIQDAGGVIYYRTFACGTVMEGKTVRGVVIENDLGRQVLLADAVIDATGHASVAAFAGAPFDMGRATDGFTEPVTVMIDMTNRDHGLVNPVHVGDMTRVVMESVNEVSKLRYLAPQMGVRESRRIKGEYTMNPEDIIHNRQFGDVICKYQSRFDPHDRDVENMEAFLFAWNRMFGLFRKPIEGEIPYRSLIPVDVENVLVTGRSFAADYSSQSMIRMQGDLQYMGEAAGAAAYMAARKNKTFREISVEDLQKDMVDAGVITPEDVSVHPPRELTKDQYEKFIAALGTQNEAEAVAQLFMAGEDAVPHLLPLTDPEFEIRDLQPPETDKEQMPGIKPDEKTVRYEAALLLGLQGRREAVPLLMDCIREKNTHRIGYEADPSSYHASKPLYYSAVELAGRMRVQEALPLLRELIVHPDRCPPDLATITIRAMERIGDPSAIERIKPYLKIYDQSANEVFNPTMQWGLRVQAARAMVKLGDNSGIPVLISYLDDEKALLRDYVYDLLLEHTGRDLPKDKDRWMKWWEKN